MSPKGTKKSENPPADSNAEITGPVIPANTKGNSAKPLELQMGPLGAGANDSNGASPSLSRNAIQVPGEERSLGELKDQLLEIGLQENLDSQIDAFQQWVEALRTTVDWIGDHEDEAVKIESSRTVRCHKRQRF